MEDLWATAPKEHLIVDGTKTTLLLLYLEVFSYSSDETTAFYAHAQRWNTIDPRQHVLDTLPNCRASRLRLYTKQTQRTIARIHPLEPNDTSVYISSLSVTLE